MLNYNKERHKFVKENKANNELKREAEFNIIMHKKELKENNITN